MSYIYDQHCTLLPRLITISSPIQPCQSHGRLERSGGFAFVYMEDERDAEDAINRLDGVDFGRKGRRIRVEWTKEDRSAGRKGGSSRRSPTSARPTKTLFVINFDPINTRIRDLERHFDKYGRVANVRIKKNFAFVQFEVQEDATRALEGTNGSHFMDRVISVEYALRDDDEKGERGNGYSPDRRGRERSPARRRSPSPYGRGRERGSPDYGRGRERGSPDYGRGGSKRSPDYGSNGGGRGDERGSPNYDRERREASPRRERREASPRRERREASPGYDRPPSHSPGRDDRD
ncbi:hypothetical protein SETIT_1G107000v2 [Setaria italica]|uniref:RRM domain-containing protein n=2 Tax=Setaria italica TaxID=4555 RepID=K3YUM5_SETIT|nr:serine/arginine-rich splicing factor RS40 isoform X1 [Setaria italica]RCV05730.1 hypothetical protein SETIT_1G107000v2 [Setaria italica]